MSEKEKPKSKGAKFLKVGGGIAIGISIFLLGINLGEKGENLSSKGQREIADTSGVVQEGSLPFDDPDKVKELLQQQVDESMLAIKINSTPYFESASVEGLLGIENPKNNKYDFQVEILLDATSEVIYTSPLVKPGQYILHGKLDKILDKGTYAATAIFYAYDEQGINVGKVGAGLSIEIAN